MNQECHRVNGMPLLGPVPAHHVRYTGKLRFTTLTLPASLYRFLLPLHLLQGAGGTQQPWPVPHNALYNPLPPLNGEQALLIEAGRMGYSVG